MKETDAKTKTCPHITNPHSGQPIMCRGSECMGWKWETTYKPKNSMIPPPPLVSDTDGYCGVHAE